VPFNFSNFVRFPAGCTTVNDNCLNANTPDLLGGLYPNANLTNGTAFFTSPQAHWDPVQETFVSFSTDSINQNQNTHLFTDTWIVAPGSSRSITWYVLIGDWNKALNFASLN